MSDRERMLRFAHIMGAGEDSEHIVRDTLAAATEPGQPVDEQRVWSLLAELLARRLEGRCRQPSHPQDCLQASQPLLGN